MSTETISPPPAAAAPAPTVRRLIRLPEVTKRVSLEKSAIYKQMREDDFPKAVKLGPKASAWVEQEIDDWIQRRIDARNSG